jgi:hypothetical protein
LVKATVSAYTAPNDIQANSVARHLQYDFYLSDDPIMIGLNTKTSNHDSFEQIELLRGGSVVSSLASAFGSGLRETRLTAMLGYLVALAPDEFCELFGFSGKARSVALETRHNLDRSDILVTTTDGIGVVEAKVGRHDPFDQSLKYPARWRVLLTGHLPTLRERARRGCRYLRWQNLLPLLDKLAKSTRAEIRFISQDLQRHLKEHHMIPNTESVEIYAREINEEKTLTLFLHGRMYGCDYEASSQLPEALYFAPHFGQAIASEHPGIHVGISYLARIKNVEVVETFAELCEVTASVRGKVWYKNNANLIKLVKDWRWDKCRRSFLFLEEPRLVFNPPIQKDKLQKGKGWLSRRVFSFDNFFEAWGC